MIFRKYEVFPCFCNRNYGYSVKQEALIILSERCHIFVTKTLKCNLTTQNSRKTQLTIGVLRRMSTSDNSG